MDPKENKDKPLEPGEGPPVGPVPHGKRKAVTERPKVGLALSSGGAKGLAHVGVIQVLEEAGIHIDAVAGTSMGAYVAALYASGCDGKELEAIAAEVTGARAMLGFLDPVFPPRRGAIKGMRIRQRLMKTIGEKTFADMERELFVLATESENYSRKVFDSGMVAERVHASIAVPGIIRPVEIDGVEYVDGGISDPLPVEVLREAGMDIVIAVTVIPNAAELRACKLPETPPEPKPEPEEAPGLLGKALSGLNHHMNYFAKGNLFDILHRSVSGLQMRLSELVAKQADVVVRPILCDSNFHDFDQYARYIAVGREEALEKIDTIKRLTSEPVVTPKRGKKRPVRLPI